MIVTEIVEINNKDFRHTYSDENYYIKKKGTDEIYSDAYDLIEKDYEYEETEDKIEDNNNDNK